MFGLHLQTDSEQGKKERIQETEETSEELLVHRPDGSKNAGHIVRQSEPENELFVALNKGAAESQTSQTPQCVDEDVWETTEILYNEN